MLTDLNKLKGIDFSKKIIYTDDLSFEELEDFHMELYYAEILDLPNKINLHTSFEEMDTNYKVLYYHLLQGLCLRYIPQEISKENAIFNNPCVSCNFIEDIRINNNIIDVALSNNHISYNPKEGLDEHSVEENINSLYNSNELDEILKKYNLKVSGKKSEKIERLIDNLTDEQLEYEFPFKKDPLQYRLTEEGMKIYKKYSAYKYTAYLPPGFTFDEFLLLCDKNQQYSPEEILLCLGYHNWIQFGKNSNSLSEEYKEIVELINIGNKSQLKNCFIYYPDFAIPMFEKMISDSTFDRELYKEELEELKEDYKNGKY